MRRNPFTLPHKRHILYLFALVLLLAFGAANVLAQGGPLTYGQAVIGQLSAQAPIAFYTFSGVTGDQITAQVIGITPGLRPSVSLLSATQQQLTSNANDPFGSGDGSQARITYTLPGDGVYSLLLSDTSGTQGDFLLKLDGQPAVETPLLDQATTTTVSDQPQSVGVAGDAAAPTTLNLTSSDPDFNFILQVYGPDGKLVAYLNGVSSVALQLPPAVGTFTVIIVAADPAVPGEVVISPDDETVPAPVATEEVAPPPPGGVCTVSGNANLRADPSTNNPPVGALLPGTNLPVLGRNADGSWYAVSYGGGQAWVAASVVTASGDCANLPLLTTTTQPGIAETEEVTAPTTTGPTATYTPTYTPTGPTATYTATGPTPTPSPTLDGPTVTPSLEGPTATSSATQAGPTATYTPSYTPTTPPAPQTAPPDANFNNPLNIQLDSTASVTDFVSYPGGDSEDRVRWDIIGMNPNVSLSGGRARLILAVSCFGTGLENVTFFTGGQTYTCGQTIVDHEVTYDSRTGQLTITAVAGQDTYVQWVLTGTATRVN